MFLSCVHSTKLNILHCSRINRRLFGWRNIVQFQLIQTRDFSFQRFHRQETRPSGDIVRFNSMLESEGSDDDDRAADVFADLQYVRGPDDLQQLM